MGMAPSLCNGMKCFTIMNFGQFLKRCSFSFRIRETFLSIQIPSVAVYWQSDHINKKKIIIITYSGRNLLILCSVQFEFIQTVKCSIIRAGSRVGVRAPEGPQCKWGTESKSKAKLKRCFQYGKNDIVSISFWNRFSHHFALGRMLKLYFSVVVLALKRDNCRDRAKRSQKYSDCYRTSYDVSLMCSE